ncbi:hypothetical protein BGZ94_001370 [Podila epigama]|nr:hypothetical protein BGZ94_001370 [Podila epigama]
MHTIAAEKQEIKRPRLQEALEMSLHRKLSNKVELEMPSILHESMKHPSTKFRIQSTLPMDWTVKSSISIMSPDDMTWCDPRTKSEDVAAVEQFQSRDGGALHVRSEMTTERARTCLMAAAYHWAYPTNTPSVTQAQSINRLLKNATNMTASDKASINEIFARSREWKQAFTALFQSCRNGACPYFYYIGSTWTILFQHGSISRSGELEAILTNSTPGLRKVLANEDIAFTQIPDITGVKAVQSFSSKHDLEGDEDDEVQDGSRQQSSDPITRRSPNEKQLSNTLLFKGHVEVLGLFSYLLNLKTSYEDGFLYQSPSLISGTPFLHAALKRAQISKCRTVSRPGGGAENKVLKEYRIEIQGVLLPDSVREIWSLFADRLESGYSYTGTSEVRSHGLNLRPLIGDSATPKADKDKDRDDFLSPKALDQFRFDKFKHQYILPSVEK